MPHIKKWNLSNLLYHEISTFDYGFSYEDDAGNTVVIYDSATFLNKIVYKYTSWSLTVPIFWDTEANDWVVMAPDINSAITILHTVYDAWRDDKGPGYIKLYEALRSKYNPIYNVDVVTGTVSENDHTGTDTYTKRGNDTMRASGSDINAAGGSDVTRDSGRDVDTLSGTDVNRLSGSDVTAESGSDTLRRTGTESTAHTGTDTTTLGGSDTTTIAGKEKLAKTGKEGVKNQVWTFDDAVDPHNASATITEYPPLADADARADIKEYENRSDSTQYGKSETTTHNTNDTVTNNLTDTTTYGKNDTTTYGKTESYQHGRVDTVDYGKATTLQHGKTDTTTYGRQDQTTYNTTDTDIKNLKDKGLMLEIKQGNQGTTMTQQMLQAQVDLTMRDNIIDMMIADFVHSNCII